MAELIDREEIFIAFKPKGNTDYNEGFADGVIYVLDKIDEMPTAEAKPIVHAHWEYDGEDKYCGTFLWHCSECGFNIETDEDIIDCDHSFCGLCGAQMDEEVKENV